MEKYQGDKNS